MGRHPAVRVFAAELDTLVRARYPFVYLVSWEEQRVDLSLAELGTPVRVLLIAALFVVALIAADLLGPAAWGLGALPIAVVGASFFVAVPERP